MPTIGVIAEYNPFHNGHAAQLAKAKKMGDSVIVVMSGNFVQRGEPAVCDKWYRTKMALLGGADLVIELPVSFACASAGYFAKGAVGLLNATGIVDKLCFGSEAGETAPLIHIAEQLNGLAAQEEFDSALRNFLKEGQSYPRALQQAAETVTGQDFSLLQKPNNTLGIEYIKALLEIGADIEPVAVPRSPGSAREIRERLKAGQDTAADTSPVDMPMPSYAAEILEESRKTFGIPALNTPAYNFIFKSLILKNSPLIPFELLMRFGRSGRDLVDISEIVAAAKSKNYTHLQLQRAVLHAILGINAEEQCRPGPQYIRVLGFRREREDLLGALTRNAVLPVLTNLAQAELNGHAANMLALEIEAGKMYYLGASDGRGYFGRGEYRRELVMV